MDINKFNKIITFRIAAELCRSDKDEENKNILGSKITGTYVLVHPLTRQFYIGSTSDLATRKYKHFWHIKNGSHRNTKIKKAFQQNPTDNIFFFTWATTTRDQAYDLEQKFLDATINSDKSLNIASDARVNGKGIIISDETRKIKSEISKAIWQNEEYRALKSKITKDYFSNPDNKERMINTLKKVCNTPEYKAKQAANANKQWADPAARIKKSEEVKRYRQDPDNCKKYLAAYEHLKKPVSIDGVIYPCLQAAADYFKITKANVMARIKSKYKPTWFYVNIEKEKSL